MVQAQEERPAVGERLRISPAYYNEAWRGRACKLLEDDGGTVPFRVEFEDGVTKWLHEDSVAKDTQRAVHRGWWRSFRRACGRRAQVCRRGAAASVPLSLAPVLIGRGAADVVKRGRELQQDSAGVGCESPASSMASPAHRALPEGAVASAWAKGDVVKIVAGVSRGTSAVVTEVAERHCTVALLDDAMSKGLGQLWPSFDQLELVSSAWRLGERVVLQGLTAPKLQHLNGLRGVVAKHPRQEHPAFVTRQQAASPTNKQAEPSEPQLRLVVRMDDPKLAGSTSVLVEARHVWAPEGCVGSERS